MSKIPERRWRITRLTTPMSPYVITAESSSHAWIEFVKLKCNDTKAPYRPDYYIENISA